MYVDVFSSLFISVLKIIKDLDSDILFFLLSSASQSPKSILEIFGLFKFFFFSDDDIWKTALSEFITIV